MTVWRRNRTTSRRRTRTTSRSRSRTTVRTSAWLVPERKPRRRVHVLGEPAREPERFTRRAGAERQAQSGRVGREARERNKAGARLRPLRHARARGRGEASGGRRRQTRDARLSFAARDAPLSCAARSCARTTQGMWKRRWRRQGAPLECPPSLLAHRRALPACVKDSKDTRSLRRQRPLLARPPVFPPSPSPDREQQHGARSGERAGRTRTSGRGTGRSDECRGPHVATMAADVR